MVIKAKKFIYIKEFEGEPNSTNFKLMEEDLPELQENEFLAKAEYLSVDPYMRPYMIRHPIGSTMIGGQVARILDSRNIKFPKDSYVFGNFGWTTHTICNPELLTGISRPYILPPFGKLSLSLGLGYLGMPGNTAYFGLLEICQPKPGETVAVSGAGGAVGSAVGQIAKLKGCRVIGFAGSDEKCDWLKNELGFDVAINYKKGDMKKALREAAPDGVDCYFDNVGGHLSSVIINSMAFFGRIAVCGAIASYNMARADWPKIEHPQPDFVYRQIKMEGFTYVRYWDRWMEGIAQMYKWILEGKIKNYETVTDGFENMPNAFIEMLRGTNYGKAVVKV